MGTDKCNRISDKPETTLIALKTLAHEITAGRQRKATQHPQPTNQQGEEGRSCPKASNSKRHSYIIDNPNRNKLASQSSTKHGGGGWRMIGMGWRKV